MRKAEAKRLKPGTEILFGDCKYTRYTQLWRKGIVKHVTSQGGVLVDIVSTKEGGWAPLSEPYREQWVPYHHIH